MTTNARGVDAAARALLSTTDAHEWAKRFCETFGGNTVNGGVVDLGLMIGWFANAIETGRNSNGTPTEEAPPG